MTLDPKRIAEWKALREAAEALRSAPGYPWGMTYEQNRLWERYEAAAREAFPALCDEVERLTAENADAEHFRARTERVLAEETDRKQAALKRAKAYGEDAESLRAMLRDSERARVSECWACGEQFAPLPRIHGAPPLFDPRHRSDCRLAAALLGGKP